MSWHLDILKMRPPKVHKLSLAATQDPVRRFGAMLTLCERLIQASVGSPVPTDAKWLADAQHVAIKFAKHLISLRTLTEGMPIAPDHASLAFIDHSSIKVLARAALETQLTLAYIFCNKDPQERRYRYVTWMLGGYTDRRRHAPSLQQHRVQLDAEAETIAKLQAEIQASPFFAAYKPKQQKAILEGDWRCPGRWRGIAIEVGYADAYFDRAYAYLCSYSHSSYLSILQMGQAVDTHTQRELQNTILDMCTLAMARFVWSYCPLFPKAIEVLHAHPAHKRLAGLWHFEVAEFRRVWK